MKDDVKEVVRSVLTDYIETNHCRKTPERFAVLDAAYSLGGFFRTEDLVGSWRSAIFMLAAARFSIRFASSSSCVFSYATAFRTAPVMRRAIRTRAIATRSAQYAARP